MPIVKLGDKEPKVGRNVFISDTAYVIGDVTLGDYVNIWPYAVIRGDEERITVGRYTNVQDHVVIHADRGYPANIGEGVSIGHRAIIHGAEIGDYVLVGMGSIVMNGAVVGEYSIVGAGAVVTEGMRIPPRSVAVGVPARIIKQVDDRLIEAIRRNYEAYLKLASTYMSLGVRI